MANRTVKDAKSVHGTNPQYLIEKIIRSRIYDSKYWKEECFALTAELLVDKAMELRFVGGVYGGNIKPTPFLCLTLKMLQIQPEKDIVVEFIKNDEFKYVRALGAYYMRLTGTSLDCYNYLEPLLNDSRKLRRQNRSGAFELVFMDDFIDELLTEDRVCDVILPRLQKRYVLEQNNEIQPRISVLEDDEDDEDMEDMEEGETADDKPTTSSAKSKDEKSSKSGSSRHENKRRHSDSSDDDDDDYHRRKERRREDRSPEPSRRRDRDRERDRDRDRDVRRERDRDRSRDRERRRSRSKDRDYDRSGRYDDYRREDDRDRSRRDRDRDRDHDRDRRDRHRERDRDRDRHRRHDY